MNRADLKRHAGATMLAIVGAAGIAALASELGSRCQCHYTPILFAERDGFVPLRLGINVPERERPELSVRLQAAGAVVDPAWENGVSDDPVAYVAPGQQKTLQVLVQSTLDGVRR